MGQYKMTLRRLELQLGEKASLEIEGHHALWLRDGAIDLSGKPIEPGGGGYSSGGEIIARMASEVLVFSVTESSLVQDLILTNGFDWDGKAVLRLDQVSFPPGARAYRHIHPGPGIRWLSTGRLEIQSDHDTTMMNPMSAWFEGASSPVQATAGPVPTAFVRAMVLPPEFFGKPTLKLLEPEDEKKPRLQTNTRFIDQVIDLSAD